MNYSERYNRICNQLNEDLGNELEGVHKNVEKIKRTYKTTFSTKAVYGEYNFADIYCRAEKSPEASCFTLAEKCIRRSRVIEKLKNDSVIKDNPELLKELEDVEMLWNIYTHKLLDLEILYVMEEEKDDDRLFTENEQKAFELLQGVARTYLSETKKYAIQPNNKTKLLTIKPKNK